VITASGITRAANKPIRFGPGDAVSTYFDLAKKVAELQFRNRDHVLLFRGQHADFKTLKDNSALHATLFRLEGKQLPTTIDSHAAFPDSEKSESRMVTRCSAERFLGFARQKRHRLLAWAILQHYEVCKTPLRSDMRIYNVG
jgi:hypothetical protein